MIGPRYLISDNWIEKMFFTQIPSQRNQSPSQPSTALYVVLRSLSLIPKPFFIWGWWIGVAGWGILEYRHYQINCERIEGLKMRAPTPTCDLWAHLAKIESFLKAQPDFFVSSPGRDDGRSYCGVGGGTRELPRSGLKRNITLRYP